MSKRIWLLPACTALLAADASPATDGLFAVPADRTLAITVHKSPARLRIDPGGPSTPVFNPDFAARAGFRAGWIGIEGQVGPVRVPGFSAVVRFDLGQGEFKRRIGWFDARYVAGADGAAGPGFLDADRVRFALRAPVPGERRAVLPLADFGRAGMGVMLAAGDARIVTRFSLERDRSIATAGAAAAIAATHGGRFDRAPERMLVHLGVVRPVRHLTIEKPFTAGPLAIDGLWARTSDWGSTAGIPDAAAPAGDPDEIVVVGDRKKRRRELRLEIGRDYLDRCSSIVFDKRAKTVTLSCR
jgi:hypothetical protein